MEATRNPLIIGAGPAGLTAALRLVDNGVTPRIYEASDDVGGLARTPTDGDWRVDPGGHRFFTRSEEVLDLWKSLLPPEEWISVKRRSAMLVNGHFVRYPLIGRDLLSQMGYRRGMHGLSSMLWSRFRHGRRFADGSASFRDWGTGEFGRYWYNLFFDGYVRKTWLTDPGDITSDWANQRIRPIGWRSRSEWDFTDNDTFHYPRLGPGQLWEAAAAKLADAGVVPSLNSPVVNARLDGPRWTVTLRNGETATGDALFSSMPLRLLVEALDPAPPKHIRAIAGALKHRGLITVAVALRTRVEIPFNWVYTPAKNVRVGRIQNYGRWSSELAPDDWDGTYLGFEYFIEPDGDLYTASDEHLTRIVENDLRALGIDSDVEHVMFVRSQHAYPVYDQARDRAVARVRDHLRKHYPSLHPMGRNGMHHYDNQDHAMLSAMLSVDRYFGANIDPWQVNTEQRYQESGLLGK
ncbi:NAD(P)/FAD-dependent oxidoreductase [Mycolicibacterium pyrenivorans]|uniref:NAD(P)/FAD-dependent oxidoreductase n=1 Tax=Mycolicibacterium pyrenivorans TaxID=187102 RepID=UPI0021F3587F|nr:NAD(P)/FAD-dependent oxidoreductase [Mycolicibacterium pyrenivorans]MCV7150617.1 NAD(P)/FAD-dependent oxidoreductase [Mycolicibacterium pyrenivorans]